MDVIALWRWPVVGMAGESVPSLRVSEGGPCGDRVHALLGADGTAPLTGADAPGLERWSAAYPFNPGAGVDPSHPPYAVVTSPGGRAWRWGDPRLRRAVEDDLGRPLELWRRPCDAPAALATVLLTCPAHGADAVALRTSVHLGDGLEDLPADARLSVEGGVRLRLLDRGDAPGGVRAEVLAAGRIALGAAVEPEPVPAGPPPPRAPWPQSAWTSASTSPTDVFASPKSIAVFGS